MALHNEIQFETDICNHLAAHGWLYAEGDAKGYDTVRALYPADVLAWVQTTQPQAWEVLQKNHGAAAEAVLPPAPLARSSQLSTSTAVGPARPRASGSGRRS